MKYDAQPNNDYLPGTWKELKTSKGRSASLTCPDCGNTCVLTDHDIGSDGIVLPSVVCPTNDCHFHKFVKLLEFGIVPG